MPADGQTIVGLFNDAVTLRGDAPSLHLPAGEGKFRSLNWRELASDVRRMAMLLQRLGVQPGDRVVQVSENRYEWLLLDLAVHLVRGVHVAIHAALAGPQIAWQIRDSGARLAFVSTAEQAAKLAEAKPDIGDDLRIVSYERWHDTPKLSDLLADVADDTEARQLEAEALAEVQPGDLATILYTSGATGEPKGVMLSHANLVANARASAAAFAADARPDDLRLCWLPLSHVYARTCDLYTWLVTGTQLALAESRERIIDNCRALHPTVINGVPYFFDRVRRGLSVQPDGDAPGRLVELLGGRLRLCCSGGAALSDATAEYFWQHGVRLTQGYGMTEASPVISQSHPDTNRIGSVGRPLEGVEVRIAADGEILTRGPHVMLGYWNRPQETAAAIRDGWLHTGDLGRLDADGYLWITGRKKDLIVTSVGKNIAPALLESLLLEDPLIAQAVVLGEGRSFLAALIVPAPDALRAVIIARRIPVRSPAEAVVHPEVLALYRERIDRRLAGVSACEQIGRFAILDRALTIESGELTPTLKLRRAVIQERFAEVIAQLYADSEHQLET